MAADIFFFATFDQIDNVGSGNGQTLADSFGPDLTHTTSERFLVSSVHKRKQGSSDNVKAIAIVEGKVVVQPDYINPTLCTIFLKPRNQPGEGSGVSLPKIKYFAYRGVLTSSLFADISELPGFLSDDLSGDVDLLNRFHDNIPIQIFAETILPARKTTLGRNTPLEYSFINDFLDPNNSFEVFPNSRICKAGESIGIFDPNGFSLEIILDDLAFQPTVEDATSLNGQYNYVDISAPSPVNPANLFISANAKEKVVHYLDPAAFYGNLYGGISIGYVDASGTNEFQSNEFPDLINKFYNRNKVYIDIRNEHNLSFNYYNSVGSNAYYSQYASDEISIETENTSGVTNSLINYYASGWPLLILDGTDPSQFQQNNSSDKNIVRIKLPAGNKNNPVVYSSVAYRNAETPSSPFVQEKFTPEERFVELSFDTNTQYYSVFEASVPGAIGTNVSPYASYIRIKYFQRLVTDLVYDKCNTDTVSNVPLQTEVQFPDNIFFPYQMTILPPFATGTINSRVFDEETYVNLRQERLYGVEDVSSVGIAEDDNTLTLFAFGKYRNYNLSKKLYKSISTSDSYDKTPGTSFIESFVGGILSVTLEQIEIQSSVYGSKNLSYLKVAPSRSKTPKSNAAEEPDGNDLIAFVFNKTNFQTQFDDALANAGFTPGFPIRLCITNRNDRDDDPYNEIDANPVNSTKTKFFRCEMILRGFTVDSNGITEVIHPLDISMFAYREPSDTIQLIFRDELSVLTGSNRLPYTFKNQIHSDIAKPSPAVHSYYSTSNIDKIFGKLYKEELLDFTQKCYSASGIASGNVTHYSSFLCYAYALSQYVEPSGTTANVTFGTQNVFGPPSENVIIPDTSPWALRFIPGTVVGTPDPDRGGPGSLKFPVGTNAGALVETAMTLAIYKISLDLDTIHTSNVGLANMTFNGPPNGADRGFDVKLPQPGKVDKYTWRIQALRQAYPFFNNLCVALSDNGIPFVETIFTLQFQFDSFHDILLTSIKHTEFVDNLCVLWRNVNGGIKKSDCPKILKLYNAIVAERNSYISYLARNIYISLGGDADGFNLGFIASGKGSNGSALFNTATGNTLMSYEGIDTSYGGDDDSSDSSVKIVTQFKNRIVIPLERSQGMNRTLHLGLYGVDVEPGTPYRFAVYGFSLKDCNNPVAGIPLAGHDATSITLTHDVFAPPPNSTYTRQINQVEPTVLANSGGIMSYDPTLPTPPGAGTFNDVTKDLIISDDSIDYLEIRRSVWLGSGTTAEASAQDLVLLYASFYANPNQDFSYAKSFENLFADDVFRLDTVGKDRLFEEFPQEQIAIIMKRINEASSIVFDMKGGYIGRTVLPFLFDPNKVGGYITGDYVMYASPLGADYPNNASVFKVISTTPTSAPPEITTDWEEQVIAAVNYGVGDVVVDGTSFYRALVPLTPSSGSAVVDGIGTAWFKIADRFDSSGATIYFPGGTPIVANGEYYECFRTPTSVVFNPNDWLLLSRVETDSRYSYSGPNYAPIDPNFVEVLNPPPPGTLQADVFPRLRYAHLRMKYNHVTGEFKVMVEAYASPLVSRLDQHLISGLNLVNQCTIFGQDNTTDATPDGVIPSYNQVLTALRCFGIIEGFIEKLQEFELVIPVFSGAAAKLDAAFNAITTRVEATPALTGPPVINQTFIDHSTHDFDAIQ